ncbi:MAG: hypothetical protein B9S32_13925 [Verrucomicrobia bacterium Tous-C9LFEB]|nr:MAG: hypothetical protein B9S32_13925 [Verrucomicrobia bacterium Tous-C9LFEB]
MQHDYFDPLVVNRRNGLLVSGHLRYKILLGDGFTHADVSIVDYDEPTHLARLVAANTLLGEFDDAILTDLAKQISDSGLDVALAGWDEKHLAEQLEGPTFEDDSEHASALISQSEELQKKWNVQLGDVYHIGAHRLLCGDCTLAENWSRILPSGIHADMVWTDPPYNVDYADLQRHRTAMGHVSSSRPEKLINDKLSAADYEKLLHASLSRALEFTKPGGAIYIAHADSYGLLARACAASAGWNIVQCLIWVKSGFTLGRQDYQWQHEPILYGWKPGAAHYWQAGRAQRTVIDDEPDLQKLDSAGLIRLVNNLRNDRDTTIIREPRPQANALHPTVKPLPLVARQIWNSSQRGNTVLDLFGGSGTTFLAAEETGRRCVATELDPKFCAVILQRLSDRGLAVEKDVTWIIP